MKPPPRRLLLVLGDFSADDRASISTAAAEAAFDAEFVRSTRVASEWLASHEAHAILVDESNRQAEHLCIEARGQAKHAQVPILALSPELDELSFAEVFNWGGDDAIELRGSRQLVARLRTIPSAGFTQPSNTRGTALIVDPDHRRRIVLGRVLRNAGFAVAFGASAEDVAERCASADLVVVDHDLNDAPALLLEDARSRGCNALWIVTTLPKSLSAHRALITSFKGATVTDAFAPPENIVFVANELTRGGGQEMRASRRLLYGTKIAFRGAGRERDDFGYSYNISLGGLYVRTLAPPADDLVWLELRPPRADRFVRLQAEVRWRRPFGPAGHATVPPGFGLQITEAARADMQAWEIGYRAFSAVLGFADIR